MIYTFVIDANGKAHKKVSIFSFSKQALQNMINQISTQTAITQSFHMNQSDYEDFMKRMGEDK